MNRYVSQTQHEIICIVGVVLGPATFKIVVYVSFGAFFVLCNESDGAFVSRCIAN